VPRSALKGRAPHGTGQQGDGATGGRGNRRSGPSRWTWLGRVGPSAVPTARLPLPDLRRALLRAVPERLHPSRGAQRAMGRSRRRPPRPGRDRSGRSDLWHKAPGASAVLRCNRAQQAGFVHLEVRDAPPASYGYPLDRVIAGGGQSLHAVNQGLRWQLVDAVVFSVDCVDSPLAYPGVSPVDHRSPCSPSPRSPARAWRQWSQLYAGLLPDDGSIDRWMRKLWAPSGYGGPAAR